jgi:carbon-monoxide dehydrogenase medium subunit
VIPAAFDYEVAESVEQALELLATRPDAKLLAGGQSLLPAMKLRFSRPATLVDIGRINGLDEIADEGDHVTVGALVRHCDLERNPIVRKEVPLLGFAAGLAGDRQVRHRGTIGGSLAHADPAGDLPAIALALDAEIVARGPKGERTIPAADFFRGLYTTALAPDELIVQVRVPKTGGAGWSYLKFRRRSIDWAMVGVAALVRANGSIEEARIGLVNMGPRPVRATAVEDALRGSARDGVAAAAGEAAAGTDPPSDTWASADFRRHLARVLTEQAVNEALARTA